MYRITPLIIVLLAIGLIAIYVLEFRWFDRTIGMRSLALFAMAFGAVAGVGLGWHYSRQGRNTLEKVQLYIFFIVICTLFAPLFGSLSNRLLSPAPPQPKPVEFIEQQAFLSERYGLVKDENVAPSGYYTFFYYRSRLRRVKSKKPLLPDRERGETATLLMKTGLWGYEVVVH